MNIALKNIFSAFLSALILTSCASGRLLEFSEDFDKEDDYDAVIAVEPAEPPVQIRPSKEEEKKQAEAEKAKKPEAKKKSTAKKTPKRKSKKKDKKLTKKPDLIRTEVKKKGRKLPEIEDAEGFDGRRPKSDPFIVGEEVKLAVRYLGVKAGELKLKVLPFKIVNGRKSYHFRTEIVSNSAYSMIYEVDDWAESYVDYETMLPFNYAVHVNHSNEKKTIKSVFDHPKNKVKVWEKKMDEDGNVKRGVSEWEMFPYSQNVISAFFYIRNFQLKEGKVIKFPLTDEDNNMILEAHVHKKEIVTDLEGNKIEAFLVEPKVTIKGKFKPVGDVFLWFANDESKQIVKVESALKIGKLKFQLISRKK